MIGALEQLRDKEEDDDFFRQQRESDFGQSMMVRDSMIHNRDFKALVKQAKGLDEQIERIGDETKKQLKELKELKKKQQRELDAITANIIEIRRLG